MGGSTSSWGWGKVESEVKVNPAAVSYRSVILPPWSSSHVVDRSDGCLGDGEGEGRPREEEGEGEPSLASDGGAPLSTDEGVTELLPTEGVRELGGGGDTNEKVIADLDAAHMGPSSLDENHHLWQEGGRAGQGRAGEGRRGKCRRGRVVLQEG